MTDMLQEFEPGPPIDWQQAATSHMRHIRELAAERDAAEARCERLVNYIHETEDAVTLGLRNGWTNPEEWDWEYRHGYFLKPGDLEYTDDDPPPAPRCPHCDALRKELGYWKSVVEDPFLYWANDDPPYALYADDDDGDLTDAPERTEVGS